MFFFDEFLRESGVPFSNLSCACQSPGRALVFLQFSGNSLLLVYLFVSTIGFVPDAISIRILFSGSKRLKTQEDQKDSSRKDEDKV